MSTHDTFNRCPSRVTVVLTQAILDGMQEMVCLNGDKNMPIHAHLFVMIHRSQAKMRFQISEGLLYLGQRHIEMPNLMLLQIAAIGFQQIIPIQFALFLFDFINRLPGQRCVFEVNGKMRIGFGIFLGERGQFFLQGRKADSIVIGFAL